MTHHGAQTAYDILGVDPDDSADRIRHAYLKLAKDVHPDRHSGDAVKEERFKQITSAFRTLRDPDKRRLHDIRHGLIEDDGAPAKGAGRNRRVAVFFAAAGAGALATIVLLGRAGYAPDLLNGSRVAEYAPPRSEPGETQTTPMLSPPDQAAEAASPAQPGSEPGPRRAVNVFYRPSRSVTVEETAALPKPAQNAENSQAAAPDTDSANSAGRRVAGQRLARLHAERQIVTAAIPKPSPDSMPTPETASIPVAAVNPDALRRFGLAAAKYRDARERSVTLAAIPLPQPRPAFVPKAAKPKAHAIKPEMRSVAKPAASKRTTMQSQSKPPLSLETFAQPEPMTVPTRPSATEILSGGL